MIIEISKIFTCFKKSIFSKIWYLSSPRYFHLKFPSLNLTKMNPRFCVKLDKSILAAGFLDSIDYVLTDCDGVLWHGNEAIPGSVETLQALHKMGKHILYVTNNSTKSRESYLEKCQNLGFPASANDIISSSHCVALYLKNINFSKKVYVFGAQGIVDELDKFSIAHLPIGPDPVPEDWISWVKELKLDPDVGAVVVGFDQFVSYCKLTKASSYLKDPETLFLATNKDEQFPSQNLVLPGAGTFVYSVEIITGRTAMTFGKPEKFMLDCIKQLHPGIDFGRTIMIGDRLNTDILFGTRHGIRTLLVLTGINTLEDVQTLQKSVDEKDKLLVPDYYLPKLGDLLTLI